MEVGERAVEIVCALPERSAQEQRGCRRTRVGTPGRERGLRLAEEAWIAGLARRFDGAASQPRGERKIVGTAVERCTQTLDVAQRWIDLFRQTLEHDAVVGRKVGGCRHRRRDKQSKREQAETTRRTHATISPFVAISGPGLRPGRCLL